MENKNILISEMTLLRNTESEEACNILNAALTKKYSLSLGDSENGNVKFSLDPSLHFRRYDIDVTSDGISIVAGNADTLYFALQRLAGMLGENMPTLPETHISTEMFITSDPCIMYDGGKYYLSSFVCMPDGGSYDVGFEVYVSDGDFYDWGEPIRVFTGSECTHPSFDGYQNYWAPEICKYRDKYYIFGTYTSKATGLHGCAVFRSSSPCGKYELISDGIMTPKDRGCIDNSLYVDENGDPWMVFVHEWVSTPDKVGRMCVSRMTDDLSALTGEITTVFRADDAPWCSKNFVTDGPQIINVGSGRLAMIWSGFDTWVDFKENSYCIGVAYSENGVRGPWIQDEKLLYCKNDKDYRFGRDGGHGYIFKDSDGQLVLTLHSSNKQKGVYTFPIGIENGKLNIK